MNRATDMDDGPIALFRKRSILPLTNSSNEVAHAIITAETQMIDTQAKMKAAAVAEARERRERRVIKESCPSLLQAMKTLEETPGQERQTRIRKKPIEPKPPSSSITPTSSNFFLGSAFERIPSTTQRHSLPPPSSSTSSLQAALDRKERELKSRDDLAVNIKPSDISKLPSAAASQSSSTSTTTTTTAASSGLASFKQTVRSLLTASQQERDREVDSETSRQDDSSYKRTRIGLDDLIQMEDELDAEFGPLNINPSTSSYIRSAPGSQQASRRNSFSELNAPDQTETTLTTNSSAPHSAFTRPTTAAIFRSYRTTTSSQPTSGRSSPSIQLPPSSASSTPSQPPQPPAPRGLKDIMGGKFVPTRPKTAKPLLSTDASNSTISNLNAPNAVSTVEHPTASSTHRSQAAVTSRVPLHERNTLSASMKNKPPIATTSSNQPESAAKSTSVHRRRSMPAGTTIPNPSVSSSTGSISAHHSRSNSPTHQLTPSTTTTSRSNFRPTPPSTTASTRTIDDSSSASLRPTPLKHPNSSSSMAASSSVAQISSIASMTSISTKGSKIVLTPLTTAPIPQDDVDSNHGLDNDEVHDGDDGLPSSPTHHSSPSLPPPTSADSTPSLTSPQRRSRSHKATITSPKNVRNRATTRPRSSHHTHLVASTNPAIIATQPAPSNKFDLELAASEARLKSLIKEYNKLRHHGDSRAGDIIAKTKELTHLMDQSQQDAQEKGKASNELNDKQAELQDLLQQQHELDQENVTIEQEIKEFNKRNFADEKSLTDFRLASTQLETRLASQSKKLADARDDLATFVKQTAQLKSQLDQRQAKYDHELRLQRRQVEVLEIARRRTKERPQEEANASTANRDILSDDDHLLRLWESRMEYIRNETGVDDFNDLLQRSSQQPLESSQFEATIASKKAQLEGLKLECVSLSRVLGMKRLAHKQPPSTPSIPVEVPSTSSSASVAEPSIRFNLDVIVRKLESFRGELHAATISSTASSTSLTATDTFKRFLQPAMDSLDDLCHQLSTTNQP